MRHQTLAVLLTTAVSLVAVASAKDPAPVPPDFKLVAGYGPGYSSWLRWQYTISADGKVAQDIGPGGRGGGERVEKETTISAKDVVALFAKVKEADFFTLKEQYKGKVTDNPTLVLEVTMEKKTHKVLVYGHRHLRAKEDQDDADRFLAVWAEVIRKVPAPNPEQKPEMYKPGAYVKKKKA
ncbi:MAG: hypothetical protein U0793_26755 [Gemmataceae bacterium]